MGCVDRRLRQVPLARGGLRTTEALLDLLHSYSNVRYDTAEIERAHAQIRRDMVPSSSHTWQESLWDASANHVLEQLREQVVVVGGWRLVLPLGFTFYGQLLALQGL